MEACWDRFLKEGDILFNYMILNFELFFDGQSIIKHFFIRNTDYFMNEHEKVLEMYGNDIQKELIPWIRNEFENKQLFIKENWKPFRDRGTLTDCYMGYKKLFQYKQYYLQLSIDDYCDNFIHCIYCKHDKITVHFELALWGWKDDIREELQPDNHVIILPDNILPSEYWNIH